MLKLKVNTESRTLLTQFNEITLKHLERAFEVFEDQDQTIKDHFFKEGKELDDSSPLLIGFKIIWVKVFSNMTFEELKGMSSTDAWHLSIHELFMMCEKFMTYPEYAYELPHFKLNRKSYKQFSIDEEVNENMLFSNTIFNQFKLSVQLSHQIRNKLGDLILKGSTASFMAQLIAVLFVDEKDSKKGIEERSKLFMDMNASDAYSAWFLFCKAYDQIQKFYPVIFQQEVPDPNKKKVEKSALEKKYVDNLYWEIMENEVAKIGIFTKNGLTAKESVNLSNTTDILSYINLNIAFNS